MSAPGIQTSEPQAAEAEHVHLTAEPQGRPGGVAVQLPHSALAAQGSLVQIPGVDMVPLGKPCCGRHLTYKVEEDGHRCELRANLPQKNKIK